MSDFLMRLSERTLGRAPALEPVLSPRFAPAPRPPTDPGQGALEDPAAEPDSPASLPRLRPAREAPALQARAAGPEPGSRNDEPGAPLAEPAPALEAPLRDPAAARGDPAGPGAAVWLAAEPNAARRAPGADPAPSPPSSLPSPGRLPDGALVPPAAVTRETPERGGSTGPAEGDRPGGSREAPREAPAAASRGPGGLERAGEPPGASPPTTAAGVRSRAAAPRHVRGERLAASPSGEGAGAEAGAPTPLPTEPPWESPSDVDRPTAPVAATVAGVEAVAAASRPVRGEHAEADRHSGPLLPDALLLPERLVPRPAPARPAGHPSPDRGAVPPAPAAEGAVHVTIGRLEVQAVTAEPRPLPAPAPVWQPPLLTLDEYLRGSAGR